jgi:large subunit ribosomal protein L21
LQGHRFSNISGVKVSNGWWLGKRGKVKRTNFVDILPLPAYPKRSCFYPSVIGGIVMFAVVETGGKQYRVKRGSVLNVEKLSGSVGEQLAFENVLLLSEEGRLTIGNPFIPGSTVQVTVLSEFRAKKVRIFKMKQRKRYRRSQGHRQYYSKVRVDDILNPQGS